MSSWVDKYGKEKDEILANSIEDVIEFYGSIYDKNQMKEAPPIIIVPPHLTNIQINRMIIIASSTAARFRTKEEFLQMRSPYDFDFFGRQAHDYLYPGILAI